MTEKKTAPARKRQPKKDQSREGKPPRRYVHIGFPKSASTSLQNFYFPNHPEIYHLGNGYDSKGNAYIGDDVEMVCEVDVRLKKNFLWNAEQSAARLQPYFDYAEEQGFGAVGISSEFFSFPLMNEVDTAEKARRLRQIMGENTTVVIIIREQFSLLKSLYLEMIKGGYPGTYRKFLEYTLLYQVRSWCHDFCFDNLFEVYADYFGAENVCMLPFEILKNDPPKFLRQLSTALHVSDQVSELRSVNQASDTLGFYEQLRRYNVKFPHEFGSAFYEPFSMNRMRAYFHNELELAVPHERLADDMMRMPFTQAATKFNSISPVEDIDLVFPKALKEEFMKIYVPANQRLQKISGLDVAQFGYQVKG